MGRLLTTLPVGAEYPGKSAGPNFEFYRTSYLLPHRHAAWVPMHGIHAVGLEIGAGELSGWDYVPRCAENCSSSFHCPPSFTRPQTMTNLGVPVLSTKETSTVAVVPDTSSTVKEWIVELRIS